MKLTPEERGEEYGLGEEFLQFHSLVGTWCTESERAASEKRRADENAKKLQKETLGRKQAETDRAAWERQMRELESRISDGIAEKETMAGLLKEAEKRSEKDLDEKVHLAKELQEARKALEAERVKRAQMQKRLEQETTQKQKILKSRSYRLGRTLSLPYRILRDLSRKL